MGKKDDKNMFTRISQVGLVVKDLAKVVEGIERVLGVKPDVYGETPDSGKKYRGKDEDFCAKLAFYRFANIEIELIQPIRGESIWKEFLDSGREGLHHIRFSTDSFQNVEDAMKEKNIDLLMEGRSIGGPKMRWGCFDTEDDMKFILEIFNEFEV